GCSRSSRVTPRCAPPPKFRNSNVCFFSRGFPGPSSAAFVTGPAASATNVSAATPTPKPVQRDIAPPFFDPPPYPSPHRGEGTAVARPAPRSLSDPPPYPSPHRGEGTAVARPAPRSLSD